MKCNNDLLLSIILQATSKPDNISIDTHDDGESNTNRFVD